MLLIICAICNNVKNTSVIMSMQAYTTWVTYYLLLCKHVNEKYNIYFAVAVQTLQECICNDICTWFQFAVIRKTKPGCQCESRLSFYVSKVCVRIWILCGVRGCSCALPHICCCSPLWQTEEKTKNSENERSHYTTVFIILIYCILGGTTADTTIMKGR